MKAVGVFLWCVIALWMLSVVQSDASPKNADALYAKGVELQTAGKTREALEYYKKALRQDLQHRGAMYATGTALYELGEYREAGRALREVLTFYPDDLRATSLLARIELATGSPRQAKKLFLKVLAKYPKDVPTLIGLGQAEQMLGNRFAGEQYLKRAMDVEPENTSLQQMVRKARQANEEFLREREAEKRRKILTAFNHAVWEAAKQWAQVNAATRRQARPGTRSMYDGRTTTSYVSSGRYTSFSGPSFSISSGLLIPYPSVGAAGTQVQFFGS
jgi:tetratricopeptide (TPR) repeat protein